MQHTVCLYMYTILIRSMKIDWHSKDMYLYIHLPLEHSIRSDDLLKDVFSHVRVHGTQRVIQQVDVCLLIDRPG